MKVGFKSTYKKCGGNKRSCGPGPDVALPCRSSGKLEHQEKAPILDRLAEVAGIQEVSRRQKPTRRNVSIHIIRYSHVVNALMAGVPVPMIQEAG